MDLRELLSVPYLLEAEAVETEPGQWLLRLAYPELPDCTAEGFVVEDVLKELERRRVEIVVTLVEEGREPPVPRKPLAASVTRSGPPTISGCRPAWPCCSETQPDSSLATTAGFNGESSCSRTKTMNGW